MAKLQLALDDLSLEQAAKLVEKVQDYIDIIEIGTPFVIEEGMRAVKYFKENFPEKEVLADLKIMDAGYYEAESAFKVGADYVTVLGITDILTIKECIQAAKKYGKYVVVDMICVEDMPKKIQELESIGADYLAVHVGVDQQAVGRKPIDDLKIMRQYATKAKIAVAGGINSNTIEEYMKLSPDIVIVGSGVAHAKDPAIEAKILKDALKK